MEEQKKKYKNSLIKFRKLIFSKSTDKNDLH